jgi:spore coat protein U-like protein
MKRKSLKNASKSHAPLPFFFIPLKCVMWCLFLLPFPLTASLCNISIENINFGNIYPTKSIRKYDTNGNLRIDCTEAFSNSTLTTLPITIELSRGSHPTINPRKMVNHQSLLNYNLFTSPNYETVWGDGTENTLSLNITLEKAFPIRSIPIYGRIFPERFTKPGQYHDNLIVEIKY